MLSVCTRLSKHRHNATTSMAAGPERGEGTGRAGSVRFIRYCLATRNEIRLVLREK